MRSAPSTDILICLPPVGFGWMTEAKHISSPIRPDGIATSLLDRSKPSGCERLKFSFVANLRAVNRTHSGVPVTCAHLKALCQGQRGSLKFCQSMTSDNFKSCKPLHQAGKKLQRLSSSSNFRGNSRRYAHKAKVGGTAPNSPLLLISPGAVCIRKGPFSPRHESAQIYNRHKWAQVYNRYHGNS